MVTDLDYIQTIFEAHNLDRTRKLVLADLVARLNDYGDGMQRAMLCKFANRTLGDITLSSTWAPFSGATEKDAQKLKKAKQLVNLWFNQKIIETFFEVCVQDRDRKVFWLKYVDRLSGFRIVGSTATKRLLQSDPRISGIFLPYYIETDSYAAQTSALVLFIKNKMMVEFSDTGALYVYDQDHNMVNLVTKNKNRIKNTADLKIPSMDSLVFTNDWGTTYYHQEGRMTHQGYWQDRLSGWLNQMVLSSNNTNISFFDSKDNDVFHAKPIEKKEFKPSAKPIEKPESRPSAKTTFTQGQLFGDDSIYRGNDSPFHKTSTDQPRSALPTTAIYETGVIPDISSKWFFDDKCRIVATTKGYYVNINRGQKFVLVRGRNERTKPLGSIWIKKADVNGWTPITHFSMGNESPVGFIKESGDRLMFRLSMSAKDAHYGGNLVDGAHMVHLFGDVATELLIQIDGDEGLFAGYESITFLAPVYAGDYIEAEGWITKVGNTSRKMEFVARKVIATRPDISASAADVLEEPIIVAKAIGTCVTPKACKRK